MEVTPVIIIVLLLATRSRYPLLYTLIFFHASVGMSNAKAPMGFDVQEWLNLSRNPYDKPGHFFQRLVPALAAREILIRGGYVRGRKMLSFLVCCIALAMRKGADDFLCTQSDPWDTQSDMFCALLGSLATIFLLNGWHTRRLRTLGFK